MKISKNKKMRFFLMSQGSLDPKIRFIGQKVCSVARVQTDTQTDRHTYTDRRTYTQTDRHTRIHIHKRDRGTGTGGGRKQLKIIKSQ